MTLRLRLIISIFSVIFLTLSFSKINLWFLAWIGFVPFLFAIGGLNYSKTFQLSYFVGFLFNLFVFNWIINVTLAGWIALCLYLGLYIGIFGLVVKYFSKHFTQFPLKSLFALSSSWVVLEYIQGHLFSGFGWVLLGYSQYRVLPIIQIADLFGVYGVSFIIMLFNIMLWQVILGLKGQKSDFQRNKLCVLAVISVLLLAFGYGIFKLNKNYKTQDIRVAVIQPNIPQSLTGKDLSQEEITKRHVDLSNATAKENPDLLIWPETSMPGILEADANILETTVRLTTENKLPLLMGTIARSLVLKKNKEGIFEEENYFNSAALISKNGAILKYYHKIHLVPFGEFIPLAKAFPFLRSLAPIGDFNFGSEYVVFDDLKFKFSALICFEDIFPVISRSFAKNGTQLLINITNDAWFKKSSAPYQHLANSVFRAIENRRPLVRAANTGVSAFIDLYGHIVDTVNTGGQEIFVQGYKVAKISLPKVDKLTPYTGFGDLFLILCLLFIINIPVEGLRNNLTVSPKRL